MVSDHTGSAARVLVSSVLAAVVLALTGALVWAVGPGPNPNGPANRQRAAQAPTWQELIQSLSTDPNASLLSESGTADSANGEADPLPPTPTSTPQPGKTTPTTQPGIDVGFDDDGGEITVVPTAGGGTTLVSTNSAPSGGVFVRPVNGPITSNFGIRFHPVLRVWKLHTGTDFGVACGSPVGAAAKGTVVFTGWGGGNGWRVVVDHGTIKGHRVQTSYNHLSVIGVRVGQKVVPHQLLAKSGTTGYSTGCHLHFEVLVDGRFADPMPWLTGKPSQAKPGPLPDLTPQLPPGEQLNTKPEGESTVGTDAPDPSATPSGSPTPSATPNPSETPSVDPSATPSCAPSADPSATPSGEASGEPSADPSATPSCAPSAEPSATPSSEPSTEPSSSPSGDPSAEGSTTPSPEPTAQPSDSQTPATGSSEPSPTPSPTATEPPPATTPPPTPSPEDSPEPTPTPTVSETPSQAPQSGSVTPSGSSTPTPTASSTPSGETTPGS